MYRKLLVSLATPVLLLGSCMSFAVKPVDLSQQPISILKPYLVTPGINALRSSPGPDMSATGKTEKVEELNRSVDFNHTTHVRVQQTYSGVPVWGADSVVHIKKSNNMTRSLASFAMGPEAANTSMTGTMYQGLGADLLVKPEQVKGNEAQAINQAITLSHQDFNTVAEPQRKTSQLMVYVGKDEKAHYAFFVKLYYDNSLVTPTYILDAQSFKAYKSWNDTKTLSQVEGSGIGGNENIGRLVYDGMAGHLGKLHIQRDDAKQVCYLKNDEVRVKDARINAVAEFKCDVVSLQHDKTFWAGEFDTVNGGYSPGNDALYAGSVIKEMYMQWYKTPMLVEMDDEKRTAKPMLLEMITHSPNLERPFEENWENAVWYGDHIYLGDGAEMTHPLTSLGVIAHEISHGFTEQHSNLVYSDQSGALNESFSDMAAQAAEMYSTGANTWMIGSEVMKERGTALRYMKTPSKDCHPGTKPGKCSIDVAQDYRDGMNVHLSSGVFNRLFYLLSAEWGVQKTFGVMVQANEHYWTRTATFRKAACGVLQAAKDFEYDQAVVSDALLEVGLKDPCNPEPPKPDNTSDDDSLDIPEPPEQV